MMMETCKQCGGGVRYLSFAKKYQDICDTCTDLNNEKMWYPITKFVSRLEKLGINVELENNVPWIYLSKINGISVKEHYAANHGFTAFFYPVRNNRKIRFSDIRKVFSKIREMIDGDEKNHYNDDNKGN